MSNKNNEKNGFFKIKNYGDKLTYVSFFWNC
mgnify:CR=1 FL=1